MARNRKSAKAAGTWLESAMTKCLKKELNNPNIERLRTAGANDRGDIGNVRLPNGELLAVECKNAGGTFSVGTWLVEAERERINYGAAASVVIAKRRGTTDPLEQVVITTVRDLIEMIGDK